MIDATPVVWSIASGTGDNYARNDTIRPTVSLANLGVSTTAAYSQPVVSALLPANFSFEPRSTVWQPQNSGIATGPDLVDVITNFGGTGSTLVRWHWSSAAVSLPRGTEGRLTYGVTIGGTVPIGGASIEYRTGNHPSAVQPSACASGVFGADNGDRDGDGVAVDVSCSFSTNFNIQSSNGVIASATVSGEPTLAAFASSATTFVGGLANFRIGLANNGTQSVQTGATFVDILPAAGDTFVRAAGVPRNSQFSPVLTGPVTVPVGVSVEYTSVADPCRTEVGVVATQPCTAPNWQPWSAFSANPSLVRALRLTLTQPLAAGGSFQANWQMRTPFDHTLLGRTVYNSFAYLATMSGGATIGSEIGPTSLQIVPAVATNRIGDFVWTDTDRDGIQDGGEPGVANVAVELRTLGVDGTLGTADDISAGTATSDVNGQYAFTGVAPGTYFLRVVAPPNTLFTAPDVGGNDAVDSDLVPTGIPTTANSASFLVCSGAAPCNDSSRDVGIFAVDAQLGLEPFVNTLAVPTSPSTPSAFNVAVGAPLDWTFVVTNNGNVPLTAIDVTSPAGLITCSASSLGIGVSTTCTLPRRAAVAGANDITVTVTGRAPDGSTVRNALTGYVWGAIADFAVEATVNTLPTPVTTGPYVAVGTPVTFEYTIRNTGNSPLSGVVVTDPLGVVVVGCAATIPVLQSIDCSRSTTAATGQFANLVSVRANSVLGNTVVHTAPLFYFGFQGGITVEKRLGGNLTTQTPPTYVPVLSQLDWTYVVRNTSNFNMSGLALADTRETGIDCHGITSIAANTSVTCDSTGTAADGERIGTVTASADTPFNETRTDEDTAYYFGLVSRLDLAVTIETQTAPNPTGPYIILPGTADWHYEVTNSGNQDVTVVSIDDTNGPVCSQATLIAGETMRCDLPVSAVRGQFDNTITASATDARRLPVDTVVTSHYFGVDGGVTIEKLLGAIRTAPTPVTFVQAGSAITWNYTITNTGTVPITIAAGSVTDSREPTLSCPAATTTLAPSSILSCSVNTTAIAGSYVGTASVTGSRGSGLPDVTDDDDGYYTGATSALSVATTVNTNGVEALSSPGVFVPVGQTVTWSYDVVNTGNADLFDVMVSDTLHPTAFCGPFDLAANIGRHTCTVTAPALRDGQRSTVTASGTNVLGAQLDAEQDSFYFGADPSLTVETRVVNDDADDPSSAPLTAAGRPVQWQYRVTNDGNVDLDVTTLTLTDDGQGTITCPSTPLDTGETIVCERTDAAAAVGLHTNTATASATGPTGPVTSSADSASYFGVTSELTVDVTTNSISAPSAPGPFLAIGDPVTWTYVVTNRSNREVTGVALVDDVVGAVTNCPQTTLAAGQSMSCSATGVVTAGQYDNTATATATTVLTTTVSGSGVSHYFGAVPSLRLVVRVNGAPGDTATGPFVASGSPVSFAFDVTNIGDGPLADVALVQDPTAGPITCPRTTLAVNQTMTCTANATASPGQFSSTVTASGNLPDPPSALPIARSAATHLRVAAGPTAFVRVSSAGNYFGVVSGVTVSALTNGINSSSAPGLIFDVGSPLVWSYVVANPGNTTITSIVLTDNRLGVVTCPRTSLAPSESMTCTVNGTAVDGLYQNRATVNGVNSLESVSAFDEDFYTGRTASAEPPPVDPGPTPEPPPPTVLPITGSGTSGPLQLGATLLLAGVVLTAIRRRRRRPA